MTLISFLVLLKFKDHYNLTKFLNYKAVLLLAVHRNHCPTEYK